MPISIRIICEKEKEISLHGSECSRLYAESHKNEYYLCMHVFRRDIIDKNNIRFLDECTYNEDTLFIIQYLQHCSKCIYADILFYGYRKCDEAVTAHFTEKHYNDVKESIGHSLN